MTDLKLYDLTPSPNNLKARLALGYKGLAYERIPFQPQDLPGDRGKLVEVSRQPRTPVLVHGQTVIFDSAGIMRYLEANFPATPPLFTSDYQQFGEIEEWELFARTKLGEAIRMAFGQAFAPAPDLKVVDEARRKLAEATGALEDRLSGRTWLVGDHLTAADVACAAPLYLTDLTEQAAGAHPLLGFFRAHLSLGQDRPHTLAWLRRVMAHDPVFGKRG